MVRGLRFVLEESTTLDFRPGKHTTLRERELHTKFPLAVDGGKGHKGARQDNQVGEGEHKPPPVGKPVEAEHVSGWSVCQSTDEK